MGFPVRTVDQLLNCLGEKRKDWCLVLLLDRDNLTSAGMEMIRLLSDFDEDSGDFFDFFLPGYHAKECGNPMQDSGRERMIYEGYRLGDVAFAEIARIGELSFSHQDFRTFYKLLEKMSPNGWRHSADCEIVLFRRDQEVRSPSHPPFLGAQDLDLVPEGHRYGPPWIQITDFCSYNLDDIVRNGNRVNQFIRRLCIALERAGALDWPTVKREVDKTYCELIMPSSSLQATGEQQRLFQAGQAYLQQHLGEHGYVFVSYSTKDRHDAEKIRDALENQGIKCWMAPRNIPAGSNYAFMIENAISHCGLFLLLLSGNSMESVWVEKELLFAIGQLKRENRLYVVWCSEPLPLQYGFAYSLVDVQIANGLSLNKQCCSSGDILDILTCYYGQGLPNPSVIPLKSWVQAIEANPALCRMERFVEICPWEHFAGEDWIRTLKAEKSLEDRIPYDHLSAKDCAEILKVFPSLKDRIDWTRIACEFPWGNVMRHSGIIEQFFPFDTVDSRPWLQLLRACPDYAERCPWDKLVGADGDFWARLLKARPELRQYHPDMNL